MPWLSGYRSLPLVFCIINRPVKLFTTEKVKIFQYKNRYMVPDMMYELW